MDYFLAIDFDGTVAKTDVTDAVMEEFAPPEWLEIEQQWQAGIMGSKECLRKQMALIDAPLEEVLAFVEQIEIDGTFIDFVRQLQHEQQPFAIVSDGFQVFIDRILISNGLRGLPVFANKLSKIDGKWATSYPYSTERCASGTCKCMISRQMAQGLPVYLIGDGQSDFCLAGTADYVYAKAKLVDYCVQQRISHCVYTDFQDIISNLHKQRIGKSVIA